ncbi:MAG TPA: zinc ABC transporter substrate-binding protein [Solirubrobacteraceae bacterium]|nr:zinc ABC transporter substrate-binding protein [Solirubrobacteraceae bacterium]
MAVGLALLCVLAAGCGDAARTYAPGSSSAGGAHARFQVVAAENFWGSIAAQLAGDRATVRSILVNPNTDPHDYGPTPADARTLASTNLAIVNDIGYDPWASRLLAASPQSGRTVLSVGDLLGLQAGDNPHQWYSPASVSRVIDQIVADYDELDPQDASYFAERKQRFQTTALARYDQLRREIRSRYAGVPVGYSESIFEPLGEDLGLKLLTPLSFAKAISEGADLSAQDKQTVDTQVQQHQVKVWVFNSQNLTPDVQRVNQLAKAAHIPIATVTETLSPASDTFEQWQVAQLQALARALRQATGR